MARPPLDINKYRLPTRPPLDINKYRLSSGPPMIANKDIPTPSAESQTTLGQLPSAASMVGSLPIVGPYSFNSIKDKLSSGPTLGTAAAASGQEFRQRAESFAGEREQGKINLPEQILKTSGAMASGVAGAIGGTALEAAQKIAPSFLTKLAGSATGIIGDALHPAVKPWIDLYKDIETQNPRAAHDMMSLLELVGSSATIAEGPTMVKGLATKAVGAAEKLSTLPATMQAVKDERLIKDLTPELSKKGVAKAAVSSGTDPMGLLKKGSLPVSSTMEKTADTIRTQFPEIAQAKTFGDKINATKSAISSYAQKTVEPFLDAHPSPFTTKTVNKTIDDAIKANPLEFAPTQSGKNTYQVIKEEMMRAIKNNPQNLKGLWKARQQFDDAIEARYGEKFWDANDSSIRQATRNIRNSVTNFIDESAGDKTFSSQMNTLSGLYDANDTFAEKFAKYEYGVSKAGQYGEKIKSASKHLPVVGKIF